LAVRMRLTLGSGYGWPGIHLLEDAFGFAARRVDLRAVAFLAVFFAAFFLAGLRAAFLAGLRVAFFFAGVRAAFRAGLRAAFFFFAAPFDFLFAMSFLPNAGVSAPQISPDHMLVRGYLNTAH